MSGRTHFADTGNVPGSAPPNGRRDAVPPTTHRIPTRNCAPEVADAEPGTVLPRRQIVDRTPSGPTPSTSAFPRSQMKQQRRNSALASCFGLARFGRHPEPGFRVAAFLPHQAHPKSGSTRGFDGFCNRCHLSIGSRNVVWLSEHRRGRLEVGATQTVVPRAAFLRC